MVDQHATKGRHRKHLLVLGHHDLNMIIDAMLVSWLASGIIAWVEMRTPPHGQCRKQCPLNTGHATSCDQKNTAWRSSRTCSTSQGHSSSISLKHHIDWEGDHERVEQRSLSTDVTGGHLQNGIQIGWIQIQIAVRIQRVANQLLKCSKMHHPLESMEFSRNLSHRHKLRWPENPSGQKRCDAD